MICDENPNCKKGARLPVFLEECKAALQKYSDLYRMMR